MGGCCCSRNRRDRWDDDNEQIVAKSPYNSTNQHTYECIVNVEEQDPDDGYVEYQDSQDSDEDDENGIVEVCKKLLSLDNRLCTPRDYRITPTGFKLFAYVQPYVLEQPLFRALQRVQAIYHSQRGCEEMYSSEDIHDQKNFLHQVIQTNVMQACLVILQQSGRFRGNRKDFLRRLYDIWFELRSPNYDTCAFEHVFVGEIGGTGKVSGLHNWFQYYRQQWNGEITNYQHLSNNNQVFDDDALIVTISFDWYGHHREVGSMFIGTTPAFEMALYTYLYFAGQPSTAIQHATNDIQLDGTRVRVVIGVDEEDRLVTAFPQA